MTQEEKLNYLVEGLASEYDNIVVPDTYVEKRYLLRALMNLHTVTKISCDWLKVQDDFLQEEAREKAIVDVSLLPSVKCDSRICLWQGDITRIKADAIVNAANSTLLGCFHPNHGCIDNAIHSAAGLQLRSACKNIMDTQLDPEPAGCGKITSGYNLPAKYVIHSVGPIVDGKLNQKHCTDLISCYRTCMELGVENKCRSIAFCCISTGEYHFPNQRAAELAVDTVRKALDEMPDIRQVIFNVYKDIDYDIYEQLLS